MKMEVAKQEKGIIQYTPDEIDLIKSQIAPGATDSELKLFLYQCQKTGLDALSRQIYCIHRNTKNEKGEYVKKMTIQTSIDGFRVIAERSGQYAGQGEPEFVEENGKIICCKVRVFKFSPNGQRYEAAVGVAYWTEYAQNSPMWTKMGHNMISKVAEALALRKAFPQDLSGCYSSEEMEQSEDITPVEVTTAEPKQLPPPVPEVDMQTWVDTIAGCSTVEELSALKKDNKETIDTVPGIGNLFLNHYQKLTTPATQINGTNLNPA